MEQRLYIKGGSSYSDASHEFWTPFEGLLLALEAEIYQALQMKWSYNLYGWITQTQIPGNFLLVTN